MVLPKRADDLKSARWACDSEHPLERGDPRWVDLSPARGDHAVSNELEALRRADAPSGT